MFVLEVELRLQSSVYLERHDADGIICKCDFKAKSYVTGEMLRGPVFVIRL